MKIEMITDQEKRRNTFLEACSCESDYTKINKLKLFYL